ncbi:MAG: carboxypeptidase regulatory-like domain-containing protein [Vicinamibacterales bacterium]
MRAALAAFLLSLVVCDIAGAAEALWTVAIVGRRDVVLSMRPGTDGMPSADAHLLGPELNFTVSALGGTVSIRDANGVEWQTMNGAVRLDGPLESRSLVSPVQVAQDAVFLPLDAIAQLAGRKLVLEERGRAFLLPMPAPSPKPASPTLAASTGVAVAAGGDVRGPSGWVPFQVPKSLEERAMMDRETDDFLALKERPIVPDVLPNGNEALGLDLGVGFAQGGGAAFDATGSGTIAGYRLGVSSFLTGNASGANIRSGRVALESPSGAWTTEGGDLLSEMRGLARGVRLSRRLTSRWRPGVSFYVNDSRVRGDRAAVAYRDSLLLTRNLDVRGEAASDGSRFAAVRLLAGRGAIETFYRYSADRDATDRGVSVSVDLFRAVSAYGGMRVSDTDGRERWSTAGINIPLFRQSSISLEQTRTSRGSSNDTANAFGFQLPFGPVRVIQRYTWTDVALLDGPSVMNSGRRQMQSMASFTPNARLRFTYQLGTQWFAGAEARQWTELASVLQVARNTSFHAVTGFPSVSDRTRLRVGVQQLLPRAFRLSIDYGRLPAFQDTTLNAPDMSRLLVMLRRNVTVRTPAAGADLEGLVRDDSGTPVPGAVVSLGRYRTTTREDGRYRFAHVPPGDHELAVVREHLPAAFAVAGQPRTVALGQGVSARADISVTSLHAVHGRVFIDANGNGRIDEDEALANAVVRLGDSGTATLTNQSGVFDFYNLQPGRYAVWLDTARLRADLALVSEGRLSVDLQADRPATNVDFRLTVHDKPIIMRELP